METSLDSLLLPVLWDIVTQYVEPWEANAVAGAMEQKLVRSYTRRKVCSICQSIFTVPDYTDNLVQNKYCSKECCQTAFLFCLAVERKLELVGLHPDTCTVCARQKYGMAAVVQSTFVGTLIHIVCDHTCQDRFLTYAYGLLTPLHIPPSKSHVGKAQLLYVKEFTS